MHPGSYTRVHYLGLTLGMGRGDALSTVFAHVFAIQALIGFIYALHVEDRWQHVAACMYIAGAFGCTFAADYVTLFIFWELMSVASTFLIWLQRAPASRPSARATSSCSRREATLIPSSSLKSLSGGRPRSASAFVAR